jgi:hypothetical protein
MAFSQTFLDGFVYGASYSVPNPSFPAISFLFIGVTRLGGVAFEGPPASMQTSKFPQITPKHFQEVDFSFAHY